MLTVVSDTHGSDDHCLAGRTLTAVREAELVVHAGDFVTVPVLEAFRSEADRFRAVHGNNDGSAIRARLPPVRTVEYGGVRLAVTHGDGRSAVELGLLGRERDADAVILGHSHRPTVDRDGPLPLINPGSHAQPRGNRPAHAELEPADDGEGGLVGRLRTPEGDVFGRFRVGEDGEPENPDGGSGEH